MHNSVLVRYSEIAVKGPGSRPRMERLLASNVEEALSRHGIRGRVERVPGRILIVDVDDADEAAKTAARVFGVKSASPALMESFITFDDIVRLGVDYFSRRLKGRSFRVTARRTGEHDFTSLDVERALGAAIVEVTGAKVNLREPEYVAYVEIRGDKVFFYDTIIPGPGGLPLGSEEPALVLYSGGFDSTAALWMIWKRGSPADATFYYLGVEEALENATRAFRELARNWAYGHRPRLYVADFRPVAARVAERVHPRYRVLVVRRLMLEHASRLAEEKGYEALVTGESVGQVATQTIRNLRLIGGGLPLPVLRPVSGMDKDEVVELVRRIGLYDIVSVQVEACRVQVDPTPRASPSKFTEEYAKVAGEYNVPVREYRF